MAVLDIASAVGKYLGDGWTAQKNPRWEGSSNPPAYLNGPDGVRLFVTMGRSFQTRNRLEISGALDDLYEHTHYDEHSPKITVAPHRPPEQIAREIQRRLLPGLRELLTALRERKAAHDAANRRDDDLMSVLASIFPGSRTGSHEPRRIFLYGDTVHGDIRVNGETQFNIRVPSQYAAEVAAVVADIERRAKSQQ
jgi:hypothetical protein